MVGGGGNIVEIYYGNIRSIKALAKKVCPVHVILPVPSSYTGGSRYLP